MPGTTAKLTVCWFNNAKMPEIIGDNLLVEDKSPLTSAWTLSPLGVTDVEEVVDGENRIGVRRRDSSDSLFEIVPQCMIKRRGADAQFPEGIVLSTAGGGVSDNVGVVLDSELLILENDSSDDLDAVTRRVQFQSKIDFILWRRSIILVGLSSSEIVLVDPNTFQIKESKKVASNAEGDREKFFVGASIHSNPDPTKIDVIAIGRDGFMYLFHNISLSDGKLDSTQDQNMSVDIDIGSIRGTRVKCLDSDHAEVTAVTSASRNIIILGESDGTLSIHDAEEIKINEALKISRSINLIEDFGYNKTLVKMKKIVAFEGLLFVLFSNGKLEILLDDVFFAQEPLMLPEEYSIVHDFALVLTNEFETKLWVLYGNSDFSQTFVGIFGGPAFQLEFTSHIPILSNCQKERQVSRIMFPTQATPLQEPFAFLEVSNIGTTVFRMLETSTDSTIQKLLARGKFDQAAALSMKYGKDLDIVYKAKARSKFKELINTSEKPKAGKLFDELLSTLQKIQDAAFVCEFCSQKGFAELDWIRRILSIGKARVKDCSMTSAGKNLLLTVQKLFTFEQVFKNATIQDWLGFISEENSMFLQCKWFLSQQEFAKCEKVWRRHFDEFISNITLDNFGPFFFILFGQKLQSPEAVSLFRCILPFAVEKCAETSLDVSGSRYNHSNELNSFQLAKVNMLVDIAKRQVCSLERELCWPDEATEFSRSVISIVEETKRSLEMSKRRSEIKTVTQISICQEILDKMEDVVQNLVELAELKKCHSIRIPFQQYVEDDVLEVVNSMLYELFHRPEIETFISNFLTPFAQRKHIEVDNLFYEHVQTVIADLPFHINSTDIPQEERLLCLISHIGNVETKLKSLLAIAEEWPVPWTTNIDNAIVHCLRINVQNDPVCAAIQNTIKIMRIQVPFRCLLNKYRLTATKVQNYCGVVMAVTRIIVSNKPDCASDCREFIKHTGFIDEAKLKSIEFSLKLRQENLPAEDLAMAEWDKHLLKRLLARSLQEFKMGVQILEPEEIQKIEETSKMLANILDDRKAIEFLKLKDMIPSLADPDIVYNENYPFCLLNFIMPESSSKSSTELIKICQKISDITYTHLPDLLATAASYYARPGGTASELTKIWDIIQKIVNIPGCILGNNSQLVQSSAVTIAQFLILHCPDVAEEKLTVLQEFLGILASFDAFLEEVVKLMGNLHIFVALREQEIPLEKEFKQIYIWIFIEGIPRGGEPFFKALRSFGSTMLKFGDKNLFKQSFGCIIKEFYSRLSAAPDREAILIFVKSISDLQKELYKSYRNFAEPETDKDILDLVDALQKDADIVVTPYALRERNKTRFLNKLLSLNHFSLAGQVAIVFRVFSDTDSWSKILKGFMDAGDMKELKKVLLDLRNVSELWMLSEFAEGWKKVAEKEEGFLDLCPIPLD